MTLTPRWLTLVFIPPRSLRFASWVVFPVALWTSGRSVVHAARPAPPGTPVETPTSLWTTQRVVEAPFLHRQVAGTEKSTACASTECTQPTSTPSTGCDPSTLNSGVWSECRAGHTSPLTTGLFWDTLSWFDGGALLTNPVADYICYIDL